VLPVRYRNRPAKQTAENWPIQRKVKMLGWTIVLAVTPLGGVVTILVGYPVPFCLKLASFIFAALFLISLLTRAARVEAR